MSTRYDAVVIGVSAGAVEALNTILPQLPEDFPLPVFIVVHLAPAKESIMPEIMRRKCSLPIFEAEDKQPIKAGIVYFAPPNYHLLIEKDGYVSLSSDEPVCFSRPSVDVLFESAADAYGKALVAVVLTGANEDGTAGLSSVMAAGGVGLVQSPSNAYATMMPSSALKANPTALALNLEEIALYLRNIAL